MSSSSIQLTFTRKELSTLVEMAYLSEWVARTEDGPTVPKFHKIIEAVARKIYAAAIEKKVPTAVGYDEESDTYITDGMLLDSDAAISLRTYDKVHFREELIRELFTDAAIREATERKWKKMSFEEKMELASYHEERIRKAIEKHGLGALVVMSAEPAE